MQPLRAATECEVDLVRKRPDHGNGLRPWIPKQRPEFHLCATESQRLNLNPLTWTSPCEFHLCATEPQRLNLNPLTWTSPCEKTTIVALARKLLVALWKDGTAGGVIEGTAFVKSA